MILLGLVRCWLWFSVVICVMFVLFRCRFVVSRLLVRFLCLVEEGIIV